jgi:hypothetical protein
MIKNPGVAASVSRALQDAFDSLGNSMRQVSQSCSEDETSFYRRKISVIFSIIVFDMLEPLYEEHPQLKPEDWDDRQDLKPQ